MKLRKRLKLRQLLFDNNYSILANGFRKVRCNYCKNYLSFKQMTMDHVIPVSKGGEDALINLVPCCKRCNRIKDNKILKCKIDTKKAINILLYLH